MEVWICVCWTGQLPSGDSIRIFGSQISKIHRIHCLTFSDLEQLNAFIIRYVDKIDHLVLLASCHDNIHRQHGQPLML